MTEGIIQLNTYPRYSVDPVIQLQCNSSNNNLIYAGVGLLSDATAHKGGALIISFWALPMRSSLSHRKHDDQEVYSRNTRSAFPCASCTV